MRDSIPHVVIVHGTMGNPDGNWFPWLSKELRQLCVKVSVPRFPTPQGQNLKNWLGTLQREVGELKSQDILIGHSIGAAFVLRILENQKTPISAAFLVAGFTNELGLPEFDPYNRTFLEGDFAWGSIRTAARHFKLYHGDDDPYVPLALGKEVSQNLLVDLTVIEGGGHLNASSGYLEFKQLFLDVGKILE